MITVAEVAQHVGRSPGTLHRWIREGHLRAETTHGQRMIDSDVLNGVRDKMYPMLPLPPE